MTQAEHEGMHSKLENSNYENPHSFFATPLLRNISDSDSDIVAYVGGAMAWDVALLNLLPENVVGIHAVIKNNCNQTFTYEIRGKDAIYQGDSDLHEDIYDTQTVIADLALHTNPDFTTTPGHCMYSMVRHLLVYLMSAHQV